MPVTEYILVIHILIFVNIEKCLAFVQCVMFIHMMSYDDDHHGQPALEYIAICFSLHQYIQYMCKLHSCIILKFSQCMHIINILKDFASTSTIYVHGAIFVFDLSILKYHQVFLHIPKCPFISPDYPGQSLKERRRFY